MKHLLKIIPILAFAFICNTSVSAQIASEEKLLGCWKTKSVEFIEVSSDSLDIVNGAKGMIVCFEKNGKFTTKLREKTKDIVIGTGTFSISSDGKTIIQKRNADDAGIDSPGEVTKLNTNELSLKADGLIIHFERIR